MSLIVGIRCTDSVVLAASGPGTMPSEDGLPPARQWGKKLRVVAGQAVLGVTGHDGLAQEMALSLERCLAEPDERDAVEDVLRGKLRDALAAPVQRTVAIHRTLQGLPGFGITSNEYVVSQSMLAIPFRDSLRLFLLDPECSVTEVTDELACATIGGAKVIADPFLTFLRKVLWHDGLPDIALGELCAYWTVLHVAESCPGALTFPVQLVVMRRGDGGSIDIFERGERELSRIQLAIERGEEMIRRSLRGQPSESEGFAVPAEPPPATGERPIRKRVPEVRLRLEPRDKGGGSRRS
ncbi:MAG: hypothetical protein JSV86_13000 [Gemmatimonadota bacterium]|nr:MAG: hypothetical protein JSV86_13000 [Gemmatimonadota bacterium]